MGYLHLSNPQITNRSIYTTKLKPRSYDLSLRKLSSMMSHKQEVVNDRYKSIHKYLQICEHFKVFKLQPSGIGKEFRNCCLQQTLEITSRVPYKIRLYPSPQSLDKAPSGHPGLARTFSYLLWVGSLEHHLIPKRDNLHSNPVITYKSILYQ